jgi:hypothetical protein
LQLPADTPVTTPVVGFTVATPVLELDHTPAAGRGLAMHKLLVPPTLVDAVPLTVNVGKTLGNDVTVTVTTFEFALQPPLA